MDPKLLNSIRRILGVTAARQQLMEYFENKQVHMDSLLYPPLIQDIREAIPAVSNRVELIPFMEELDPTTGFVKIGWNLFVMGTNRKFMGYTIHESLDDLKNSADSKQKQETSLRYTTPNEIINFIVETIQEFDDGHVVLGPMKFPVLQSYGAKMPVANTYYEKNKMQGSGI